MIIGDNLKVIFICNILYCLVQSPNVNFFALEILPVGWWKKFDLSTGKYFYVNHSTKSTQWDRPQPHQSSGMLVNHRVYIVPNVIIVSLDLPLESRQDVP